MWRLRILVSRLRGLFGKRDADRELDSEIEEHLRSLTERFVRQGMTPENAELAARRQFGGVTQLRECHREAQGAPFIEHLWSDVLLSFRLLRKKLGFSLIAIAILALGIGANTAVYSVARAVIFAPLPFPQPDRLVQVFQGYKDGRYEPGGENILNVMSVRNGLFTDWREQARCFESMGAAQKKQVIVMSDSRSSVIDAFLVGDGFFETFGVPARIGRHFSVSDFAAGSESIVVLSDRMWRAQYSADRSIVGRDIVLDGVAHRVVGVMPPGFLPTRDERDPQLWLPMIWSPAAKYNRELWGNRIYARLKTGVSVQQAQLEMDRVDAELRGTHPDDPARSVVAPLDGYLFGHHERMFTFLLAAVALVLLIACANVANLSLARAMERQCEFAVRSALGASGTAILRQLLVESLVIAGIGGLAGVALTPLLIRPALALLPTASKIPRLDQVRLDPDVLLFTVLISMASGLLFGVVPAIRAARGDLSLTMNRRGRGTSLGKNESRLSDSLAIAEVAFSLALLVGGAVLTRGFLKLLNSDPGFRPAQSVALQLSLPEYRYGSSDGKGSNDTARRVLYARLRKAVQSLAGVEVAGVSAKLPLRQFWNPDPISIEGRPPLATRNEPPRMNRLLGWPVHGDASIQSVSPGYFAALGIPLIRGRLLDDHDLQDPPTMCVINQAAARKWFPDEDPIGKRIGKGRNKTTIVGVVGDCRLDGMDREVLPEVFWPMANLPMPTWLIVRASGDARSVDSALRLVVHDIDPEVGIVELSTMTNVLGDSLWRQRFSALLVGLFAMLAVLIAAVGLYAVISQAVERRTHELGVRLALGASSAQISQTVLGQGLRVTAIGIGMGTLLIVTAGRLLLQKIQLIGDQFQGRDAQAYQVSDLPWMLAAVAAMLIVLTLLACWVPLRRAMAVDPVSALRAE